MQKQFVFPAKTPGAHHRHSCRVWPSAPPSELCSFLSWRRESTGCLGMSMWFGSQTVLIWFIYLLGASSILGLSHSEKTRAGILVQGGVRVLELNKVEEHFCTTRLVCLPNIRPSLHLAACPVIDADHLGQALPTPRSVVLKKGRESPALSFSNVLFWVKREGGRLLLTPYRASLHHSVQVTMQSRDSGLLLYWGVCVPGSSNWSSVDT